MSTLLRILLVIVSVLCSTFIFTNIRKSNMKIEDALFWIVFAILLIVLSVFPQIVVWGASVTGVQSPANFIFLIIIFLLIIKLFEMTVKVSQLESKIQTLTQTIAIMKHNEKKQ